MQKNHRLIIFFIPPEKIVNGGILSIFSVCQTSRQFKDIHKSEVVLCTYPGTKSYRKNDLFVNDETIYSFDEIVKRGVPSALQIHIPEYASGEILLGLKPYSDYLQAIKELRINIMDQNILMMPRPAEAAKWFSLTPEVTQTTAHNKYSTQELADKYNLPTHHLSTFVDHQQYKWVPYSDKQDLIVFSPDARDEKQSIITKLKKELPQYSFVTIQNMTYEKYKDVMSKAKFTLTFGEGFDGYFVEAFFSGGITFAVYNSDFFPDSEFSKFQNIYPSYTDMLDNIVNDIKSLDSKDKYEKIVSQNLNKINKLYSFSAYTANVKKFYLKQFSYLPKPGSALRLIGELVKAHELELEAKEAIIRDLNKAIEERQQLLEAKEAIIRDLNKAIEDIRHSHSWKLTQPLRSVSALFKNKSE